MVRKYITFAGLLTTLVTLSVFAEQSETFGNYTVHYNAFTTNHLSPEIAKTYKIPRSKNRALLNISILRKVMGTTGKPVKARINATAVNMNSQLKQLEIKELVEPGEPGAIYYLAETSVNHGETLTYTVNFTPEGEEETHTLTFQQQFIID